MFINTIYYLINVFIQFFRNFDNAVLYYKSLVYLHKLRNVYNVKPCKNCATN